MRSIGSAIVMTSLAAALAIMPGKAARADLLLDITGDSVATCGGCGDNGATMGWAFTVVDPVTIDGLGFFDVGAASLGVASVPVGLWTGDGTSLLAQVTITDASTPVASTDANGDWLFETIVPLTLPAGDYLLGAGMGPLLPWAEAGDGVNYGNLISYTTSPDITVTGGQVGDQDAGFEAPLNTFPFPIFGPSLRQAVPEPGTLAVLAMGITGLARVRGRIRRDRG